MLLGVFGVVCFLKYRERLAKGEVVAEQEKGDEPGDATPDSLANLSEGNTLQGNDSPQEQVLTKSQAEEFSEVPAMTETEREAGIAGVDNEPPSMKEGIAVDETAETAQNKRVPLPPEDEEDPFAETTTAATPPVAPPPESPVVTANPTKLEEIVSEEPATLGTPEGVETASSAASVAKPVSDVEEDSSSVTRSESIAVEPAPIAKTVPKAEPPASILDEEEEPTIAVNPEPSSDQRLEGFREVKIGSNQAAGKTRIVESGSSGSSARSVSDEKIIEDELPSQDLFVPPETARKETTPVPKRDQVSTPAFAEENEFQSPASATSPPVTQSTEGITGTEGDVYVVKPRDTYWKISKLHYGTTRYFLALARYNQDRVPDPRLMRPGAKIRVPSAEVLEQQFPDLLKKPTGSAQRGGGPQFFMDQGGVPKYRVGPKDNLSGISGRYLGDAARWNEIYQLNRELLQDANRLKVGTVLSLPAEATQQQMAREPQEFR